MVDKSLNKLLDEFYKDFKYRIKSGVLCSNYYESCYVFLDIGRYKSLHDSMKSSLKPKESARHSEFFNELSIKCIKCRYAQIEKNKEELGEWFDSSHLRKVDESRKARLEVVLKDFLKFNSL